VITFREISIVDAINKIRLPRKKIVNEQDKAGDKTTRRQRLVKMSRTAVRNPNLDWGNRPERRPTFLLQRSHLILFLLSFSAGTGDEPVEYTAMDVIRSKWSDEQVKTKDTVGIYIHIPIILKP
jgi:hypothetical protein